MRKNSKLVIGLSNQKVNAKHLFMTINEHEIFAINIILMY